MRYSQLGNSFIFINIFADIRHMESKLIASDSICMLL